MAHGSVLSPAVRDALARLATISDRTSPVIFAGREDEFSLLSGALQGVQRGELGHTVVVQGVPGAGKTALLNEYATRLLTSEDDADRLVVPVPLTPGVLDSTPAAMIEEIDKEFREYCSSDDMARRVNRAVGGASLVAHALFATLTKKDFDSFRPAAKAPNSLPIAFADYVAFRFNRRDSTIMLLVDEAQNLPDSPRVRRHLDVLHQGVRGRTRVLLACFGLQNTVDRLRELGLSRLARGHARTIGVLSNEDARQCVTGTLEVALADFTFDEGPFDKIQRSRWINGAADAILNESANFPQHMTNGCSALAEVLLRQGIGDSPPAEKLRELCREHKRDYYDARLRPWAHHTIALAHAFDGGDDGWANIGDVKRTLMASDNFGDPVDSAHASKTIKELHDQGFLENRLGACRPAIPSLLAHFAELREACPLDNVAVRTVRRSVETLSRARERSSS